MNGFARHGLDEDAFGEKKSGLVSSFDAFPKAKPQYVTRTSGGGKWTLAILTTAAVLVLTELARWWRGAEVHTFSVEKGIGHDLQINLDVVVAMRCADVHVNVQDAAGDRILAAEMLKRDPTQWARWVDARGVHRLGRDAQGRVVTGEGYYDEEGFGEEHVHDIVAAAGRGWLGGNAKWSKTPKLKKGVVADSCRIFGSLVVNKVQGDFHITARGHGYQELGQHLDHSAFNFSHIISELSFGPFYPTLLNPLDKTVASTPNHFQKFQYFLSVVPTIYSLGRTIFPASASSNVLAMLPHAANTIFTNQYAVTSQSILVGEMMVPGIFFKYDIEPLLLTVEEVRESWLRFVVKIVNVVSGVFVAGHWTFAIWEAVRGVLGKGRTRSQGVLHGRSASQDI